MNSLQRFKTLIREPLLRRADRRELARAEAELNTLQVSPAEDEDFMEFLAQAERRTARLRSVVTGYGTVDAQKLEMAEEVLRDLRSRKAAGRYTGSPRQYGYAVESSQARIRRLKAELTNHNEGTPC